MEKFNIQNYILWLISENTAPKSINIFFLLLFGGVLHDMPSCKKYELNPESGVHLDFTYFYFN